MGSPNDPSSCLIIMNQFGFAGVSIFDIVVTVIMIGIIVVSLKRINFWGILFPLAIIVIIYSRN